MTINERQEKVCDLLSRLRQERNDLFFAANDGDKHIFRVYSHSGLVLAVTKEYKFSGEIFRDYMKYIPNDQSGIDLKAAIKGLNSPFSLENWIKFYSDKALLDTWIEAHRRWVHGIYGNGDSSGRRKIEKNNQQIIAVNNHSQIADFEFTAKIAGRKARADLVLFDERKNLLTYVEYKCTYQAVTSTTSGFLNHIIDMSETATCDEINQEAVKRYHRRLNRNVDSIILPRVRIVTLITFDKDFNGEKICGQRLTPQALYNHLRNKNHPKANGSSVKDFLNQNYPDALFLLYDRCEDVDFSTYENDLLTLDKLILKLTTTAQYGVRMSKLL